MKIFIFFIFVILIGELLFVIRQRKGLRYEILFAMVLVLSTTVWGNMLETSAPYLKDSFWRLTFLNSMFAVVPIIVLVGFIEFSLNLKRGLANYISIAIVSITSSFISIGIGLYLSCELGLGCV